MTVVANKVRIYELAKEVKKEPKQIIEDARRFGVDVSVPSNSVPKEIAERIREKYDLVKKPSVAARAIKIFKKEKTEDAPAPEIVDVSTIEIAQTEAPKPAQTKVSTTADAPKIEKPEKPASRVVKIVSKKDIEAAAQKVESEKIQSAPIIEIVSPVVENQTAETIAAEESAAEQQTAEETIVAPIAEMPTETTAAAPAKPKVFSPSGNVKVLKLNQAALRAGYKEGEKINIPQPEKKPAPAVELRKPFERSQPTRGDAFSGSGKNRGSRSPQQQFLGTPGENTAPQMEYRPTGSSRKQGRSVKGAKGEKRDKFTEREVFIPERLPLEKRLQQQISARTNGGADKQVRLVEGATVREFAEKLGIAPRDIVQLLIKRGIFATVNQPLNTDVAADLAKSFGYQITFVPFEEMVVEEEFEELLATDADDIELPRAPVVTVMGHVDHGKTSLLDGIRQANVAAGEAGGITQHIGAYSVNVPNPDNPEEMRRVVFLDTPGHEAFTMMRARGAKATDVVVLVVAADDGVMPQTIEAIEHAKAAKVPIVVAINKIDKPDAQPDRVKQELTAQGLQPVEWGGETEMVEVSAKKKENLDVLLETILLTADILELKASPTRRASGVVLEAKLDKGRGAVATVLVQQGTLRVGDPFIVGNYSGKVRAMFSDRGESVTEAAPATPVEVLGLQGVPQAGDQFQVVADVDRAQEISNQRLQRARNEALVKTTARGLESLGQADFKELLIILKTDVQGSVEVLRATLEKLSTEKVKVKVIRSGVGAITESDVLLASATQADNVQTAVVIIGFNVRPESRAAEVAKSEKVDIRLHSIIYKVEEEIRAAMIGMLDAIEREVILGHALVQEVFKISRVGSVAGCRVQDGIIRRTARARLIRDGVVVWEGELESLKRFKEDAAEVREGFECGIGLHRFNDIKVGDQIEAYTIEKVAATEL
jgi:translation initiation factor IF-2